jgi:hypothetical protein
MEAVWIFSVFSRSCVRVRFHNSLYAIVESVTINYFISIAQTPSQDDPGNKSLMQEYLLFDIRRKERNCERTSIPRQGHGTRKQEVRLPSICGTRTQLIRPQPRPRPRLFSSFDLPRGANMHAHPSIIISRRRL